MHDNVEFRHLNFHFFVIIQTLAWVRHPHLIDSQALAQAVFSGRELETASPTMLTPSGHLECLPCEQRLFWRSTNRVCFRIGASFQLQPRQTSCASSPSPTCRLRLQ